MTRITAEAYKAEQSSGMLEKDIHREILDFLRRVLPKEAVIHHSANESHVGGSRGRRASTRKKADGMVPGWPDFEVFCFKTVGPFFLEVKREGGKVEPHQLEVHKRLRAIGYPVAVVRSVDDARGVLSEWNIPTIERAVSVPIIKGVS